MRLTIYSKSGEVKSETDRFEYNGQSMEIPFVSTSIDSPVFVNFDVGDYLYFRGDKFRLKHTPSVLKQARPGTAGDAFVYDNMKFVSIADDLAAVDFLDVVLFDNNIHYSTRPGWSFFGDAKSLADRIQANLDRIYKGSEKWTIVVHSDVVLESKNIQVSNIKCWAGLGLFNSIFGLTFIIRGRTITVGSKGSAIGKIFRYGAGMGLFNIQKTYSDDTQIITRLRAFGSTKNLPHRYYNNLKDQNGNPYILESADIPNLMLPSFPYDIKEPENVYVDSPNISKYGVREERVYFDGSGGLKDIYPSIEHMTASDLAQSGIIVSLPSGDNGKLNECLGAENPSDNGVLTTETELPSYFKIYLKDLGFDLSERDSFGNLKYAVDSISISMRSGMNESRGFGVTDVKKDTSLGYTRYVVECNRAVDSGIGMAYPNSNWKIEKGDKLVILGISMPVPYVRAASQRVLNEALLLLSEKDKSESSYTPNIDSKVMAENPSIGQNIREGDAFAFEDSDLNISESETIQSLKISYGESLIPEYSMTLSGKKKSSTIEQIQDSLGQMQDSIGEISKGGGGGGSIDSSNFVKKKGEESQTVEGHLLATGDLVAYTTGEYEPVFPIAGEDLLGCIKPGDGVEIEPDGTLNVIGGGSGGGGIENLTVTGSGNAVTDMTKSADGKTITATKGTTFTTAATFTDHVGNGTVHITANERNNWNSSYNNSHTHSNKSVLDGLSAALVQNWNTAYSNSHTHSNKSFLDLINQGLSTTSSPTFANLYTTQNIRAQGDIIAYSTGSSLAPFAYWKPSVSAAGVLSWTNTTSETTPTSVNIKGADGTNGQGTTYQWSGTSLRVGTISPTGATSWGSYVDLKGTAGTPGATGSLTVTDIVTKTTGWKTGGNNSLYVGFSGGNALNGYNGSAIGNLYINYVSSSANVRIDNAGRIYGNGVQITSDERLKDIAEDITVLNKIDGVRAFYYTRKDIENSQTEIGVSAQEIEKVFPEIVSTQTTEMDDETYLSVDYSRLAAIALQGLKELKAEYEKLRVELDELKTNN